MIIKCEKFPQLHVYDLGIIFTGGVANVTNPKKIKALKAMQGFEFEFLDNTPVVENTDDKTTDDEEPNETD